EPVGGVQAGQDVAVDGLALAGVGVEVVVVEGQRRQLQAVLVEQLPDVVGVGLAEPLDLDVGGGEGAVAQVGPGGHLQGLETVLGRPGRDLLQAPVGQARGQAPQSHSGTYTQVWACGISSGG